MHLITYICMYHQKSIDFDCSFPSPYIWLTPSVVVPRNSLGQPADLHWLLQAASCSATAALTWRLIMFLNMGISKKITPEQLVEGVQTW